MNLPPDFFEFLKMPPLQIVELYLAHDCFYLEIEEIKLLNIVILVTPRTNLLNNFGPIPAPVPTDLVLRVVQQCRPIFRQRYLEQGASVGLGPHLLVLFEPLDVVPFVYEEESGVVGR